jgi:hypothetical protein
VADLVDGNRRLGCVGELRRQAGVCLAGSDGLLARPAALDAVCARARAKRERSRCVVGLTITTAPNPSSDGQAVTISGRLLDSRPAHAVVLLWRRLPGNRRFRATEATRTNRSGQYSMTALIDGNRWWYVTARGLRSRTVHQRVQAVITLTSSETRAAPGDQVLFMGSVEPPHPGEQMVLEQLGPTGWQPVAQGSLDGTSTFSISYAFPTNGTYQLRAYLHWGARNINSYSPPVTVVVNGIFKIKHVVMIMQENRSFDHYFGTYPGADGIPGLAGNPGTVPCAPDPVNGGRVQPFHDTNDKNYGGPHGAADAEADEREALADPGAVVIDVLAAGFRARPGFLSLWYGGLRTERVRDVTRPTRAAIARSIERILANHWPDASPDARATAAQMVVLAGDGLLREAFRVDRRGDAGLIEESKLMLASYLTARLGAPRA